MSDTPLLVDAQWLSKQGDSMDHVPPRIADLRWSLKGPPGRQLYEGGHIPGAVFVDLDTELAAHPGAGRHPFPTEEQFARLLSRLGIDEETHVVAYDEGNNSVAARLWFMLRVHGHRKASLLDGGLKAWTEAGLPLSKGVPRIEAAPLRKLRLDRSRVADIEQVKSRGDAVLLDARAPERYRGETEPIDKKAGHIPGALNAPWAANLGKDLRFRPTGELRDLYKLYKTPIVSCGSGVTACHDAFAMELAGLPLPRLYVGSWSDWSSDPSRPIATGPEPG